MLSKPNTANDFNLLDYVGKSVQSNRLVVRKKGTLDEERYTISNIRGEICNGHFNYSKFLRYKPRERTQ